MKAMMTENHATRVLTRHLLRAVQLAVVFAALQSLLMAPANAAEVVGAATRVQGTATATDSQSTRNLAPASPVHKADQLATGDESRLEVTLADASVLTMGANATLKVNEFVYQDPSRKNTLEVFAVGAFRLVSGAINKSDGDNIQVVTPAAALGIRGSDIWGGPIDGAYGVFLIDGQVTVTTNAGSVTLTEPGSGTNIADINQPPGPVTQWPQEKVDRAVAAVTFQ